MFSILKTKKLQVSLLILLIIGEKLCVVYAAVVKANALNGLIALNWQKFLSQELFLIVVWAAIISLDWMTKNYQMKVIQDLNIAIRDKVARQLSNSSYRSFHSQSVGAYVSWLNNDIQTINKLGFEKFFMMIKGIASSVFSIVALIEYHWSLALITVILLLMMLSIPKIFGPRIRSASLKTTLQNEEFLRETENTLNGFGVFASLNLLRLIPQRIYRASVELKKVALRQTKVESAIAAVGLSTSVLFQIIVQIFTGYLAFKKLVTIGAISATSSLTRVTFTALSDFGTDLSLINGTKPIFKKFNSIPVATVELPQPNEKLEFKLTEPVFAAEQVSYDYGEIQAFAPLSFRFENNGKYLLTGQCGSGKSTLFKVMNGFLNDYQGSVKFYGKELRSLRDIEIIDKVMLLEQTPYLFTGTVRENIALGDDFCDAAIWQILEKVGLSKSEVGGEFLNYQVGDNGRLLSGSQRQRLSLARGLIRGKKIVLIDEGTANVDSQTSIDIERSLLSQADLTVIMSTHNPHPELFDLFTQRIQFPQDFLATKAE